MRITFTALVSAAVVASAFAAPALAGTDGSNGGDREPSGGAFMSSYPEQGSTGIQRGGPPRSADVPRSYQAPESTETVGRYPAGRYPTR